MQSGYRPSYSYKYYQLCPSAFHRFVFFCLHEAFGIRRINHGYSNYSCSTNMCATIHGCFPPRDDQSCDRPMSRDQFYAARCERLNKVKAIFLARKDSSSWGRLKMTVRFGERQAARRLKRLTHRSKCLVEMWRAMASVARDARRVSAG